MEQKDLKNLLIQITIMWVISIVIITFSAGILMYKNYEKGYTACENEKIISEPESDLDYHPNLHVNATLPDSNNSFNLTVQPISD